jgi:hypothetical protein
VAERGEPSKKTSPYGCYDRRYLIELIPAMLALAVALGLLLVVPRTPAVRMWMLGLGSVGTAYTVVVSIAAIRRLDELQQRIHLIAIAVSFAVTGVIVTMTKFLQRAGLPEYPTGNGLWVVMFGVWWAVAIVLSRRYR